MMTFIKKYYIYAVIAVWAITCFCFFQFCYPYHFFYKEQNQIFLMSWDYLSTYFEEPGGIACLIGDFFTQFYYYLYAGAVIITLAILLLGDLTRRLLQRWGLGIWSFWIALLIMTVEAWFHLSYNWKLSATVCHIGYIAALYLCSLLYHKRHRILTIFSCIIILFVTYLLMGIPQIGKFRMPEWELEEVFAFDNEYYWGNDDKVIKMTKESKSDLVLGIFFHNLSQARKGTLPDHLLDMQPIELGTMWNIGPETPLINIKVMNELYFLLGDVTYAERAAMMGNVFAPENRNVRMIRRLAECNLISGDKPAAEKYLGILKNTLVYRQWAEQAPKNPFYAEKAKYINQADTIRLGDNARTICRELLDSNPDNTIALDYLLCHDLQQCNVYLFKEDYDRYCQHLNKPRIKPLYQQALLIYMAGSHASEEEMLQYVKDLSQLQGFNAYNAAMKTGQTYRFKNTYWYYFEKNNKKENK